MLKELQTIYLEFNPISKLENYKSKLLSTFPKLEQIDANMITKEYKVTFKNDATMSNLKKEIPAEAKAILDKEIGRAHV